jgi:hypothetical protein
MAQRNANSGNRTLLLTLGLATIIDVGAGWWLGRRDLGQGARIAIAMLPVPANLVLIALIVQRIRKLDEFFRRIHLEAVAIAFLLTGLAVFVYGYLEMARAVRPLNVAIVWVCMTISYGVGYLVALKHYR